MSPANLLIIFILVIMIFMFIVILACGKTVGECDPKPGDAQHTDPAGGNSGAASGNSGTAGNAQQRSSGGTGDSSSGSSGSAAQDGTAAKNDNDNVDTKADDAEEIQCRDDVECGHNQTSNINDPIKIPTRFQDFFNHVATAYGLRGDLTDANWQKVSTSKNTRTQSLNNLDIKNCQVL